ncbi:MAG: hypothetical protein LUC83_09440 [Clostridiales bacterium]|nr:hypothetical protein [Clostridiales bacterium]
MAANRIIHEQGEIFDCSSFHGKYATIDMTGQDVGYARVGIISSGKDYILFQFRGRRGLAAKAYVRSLTEVKLTERMRKKETELITENWDEDVNPFCYFVGDRCDIHMHQTRMFEATPGFFGAKILYVDQQNSLIRIKENSKQFNVSIPMICGIMQTT